MSIRSAYNERVSQMSFGEGATYCAGMFVGEIAGLAGGAIIVKDVIDNSSVYQPLQDRITELSKQNTALSQVTEQHLLQGYGGKTAVEALMQHRIEVNNAKIHKLHAEQPKQISTPAALGTFVGVGLVGVVAGTAIAYGTRRAVLGVRSHLKRPETTGNDSVA